MAKEEDRFCTVFWDKHKPYTHTITGTIVVHNQNRLSESNKSRETQTQQKKLLNFATLGTHFFGKHGKRSDNRFFESARGTRFGASRGHARGHGIRKVTETNTHK